MTGTMEMDQPAGTAEPLARDEREELLQALFAGLPGLNPGTWQHVADEILLDLVNNLPGGLDPEDDADPEADIDELVGDLLDEEPAAVGEQLPKMGERNRIARFAERNAAALRKAGRSPRGFVALFDRLQARDPRLTAAAVLGDPPAAPAPRVETFAEKRAHAGYEKMRVRKFCEENHAVLRKFGSAKDPTAAMLAAFDSILEQNPAARLEDLTGGRAD